MADAGEKKSATFNIVGQYAKDISFECPVPSFAKEAENINMHMDVRLGSRHLTENLHETVMRLKVEAKNAEENVCFLAEVEYAGVYQVEGLEGEQLEAVLQVDGAAIIYPFARQVVMGIIADAGYRAPQLAPMNFHAMYTQNKQQQAEQQQDQAAS